jgi:RNA polymerase sigma factor (sigma-70 family)
MKTLIMEIEVAQKLNARDIVETYRTKLTGFIRRRVKRLEDAEDIAQDVFYQLAEAERLLKPIEEVAAWIYTVARNRITDYYRKKRPDLMNEIQVEDDEEGLRTDFDALAGVADGTPETEYLHSVIWDEMAAALANLPPEQRGV